MFLLLSKLLPILVYPLSLAGILLALALLLRKKKWRTRVLALSLAILWLGGNRWVSAALVKSLEWQYLPPSPLPPAEAIVILGGGTAPAQFPRPMVEVEDAGDRVLYGAMLYRQGAAPLVVVTGGKLPWTATESNGARNMTALLTFLGVPQEAILLEERSANTYQNAVFTRQVLEPLGIRRILLVTSAMHMPRSVMLFEKQGFEVIPAPTDFRVTVSGVQKPLSETWPDWVLGLFPSADNLNETTLAIKEYLGILVYRLRGWL